MEFLESFEVEELSRLSETARARKIKRFYHKDGFVYQLSLYGVLTNRETGESEYRRIEILSNTSFEGRPMILMYHFFKQIKPVNKYTIWLYDGRIESVHIVGRFD